MRVNVVVRLLKGFYLPPLGVRPLEEGAMMGVMGGGGCGEAD